MLARYCLAVALATFPVNIPKKHGPQVLRPLKAVTLDGIDGPIEHMTADVKGHRIFVAANGHNSVEVFEGESLRHVASIPDLAQPQDLIYLEASGRLLVSNAADGTVRTFDGKSLKLINSVSFGGDASGILVTPDGRYLVCGWGVGGFSILDVQSGGRVDIPLKSHPEGFRIDGQGNRIFINLPGVDEVAVVDRRVRAVTDSWPIRQHENGPMALDDASHRLFIACRRPARLLVLNSDDGSIVNTLPTVGDANDVFYDRAHKLIFVIGGEAQVAAYEQTGPDAYTPMGRTDTVEDARTGLLVPEWNRLFVAARNRPPDTFMQLFSFAVEEAAARAAP